MPKPILLPNQGALSKITDQAVREEIRKLWEHHNIRNGAVGPAGQRFITKEEFDALNSRIFKTPESSQGYRATTLGGEGGPIDITTGGGDGGGGAAGAIYFHYDPPSDPTAWIAWWNTEEGALKVWYTPPGDPDSSQWVDAMPHRQGAQGEAGTAGSNGTSGGTAAECRGRLTLTSGTPVPAADQSGKTTIYWTPYNGATIALYDGSTWTIRTSAEVSLSLSGIASGSNYDVFGYWTGSALALVLSAAWASDTTRTDALTLVDGVLVKSADNTRRYLGTIRGSGSGSTEDSAAKRWLFNQYNRVRRHMQGATETANTWSYNSGTIRQANANAANQLDYIDGDGSVMVEAHVFGAFSSSVSGFFFGVGVGVDSTTTNSALCHGSWCSSAIAAFPQSFYRGQPGQGRHYLAWLEAGQGSGTNTWYGDNGGSQVQSGITGSVVI